MDPDTKFIADYRRMVGSLENEIRNTTGKVFVAGDVHATWDSFIENQVSELKWALHSALGTTLT